MVLRGPSTIGRMALPGLGVLMNGHGSRQREGSEILEVNMVDYKYLAPH